MDPCDTFRFPLALGRRLKRLRKRAGLSQQALAWAMGRLGRNGGSLVSRLERGMTKYPTLALVADYLRACGASFADVADILNSYTSQGPVRYINAQKAIAVYTAPLPPAEQRKVEKYVHRKSIRVQKRDRSKLKPVRQELDTPQRVMMVRRMYGRRWRRQQLEVRMLAVLKDEKYAVPREVREDLCRHGRKVFDILQKDKADHDQCERRILKARERLKLAEPLLQAAVAMEFAAREVYDRLAESGRLDWMPPARDLGPDASKLKVFNVVRAERKLAAEEQARVRQRGSRRGVGRIGTWLAVNNKLQEEGMQEKPRARYAAWAYGVFDIVQKTGPGEERDRLLAETAAAHSALDRVPGLQAWVVEMSEKWKESVSRMPE